MNALARTLLAAWIVFCSPLAAAHEFWLRPASFFLPAGSTTTLGMFVGEHFEGDPVAVTPWHAAGVRVHGVDERMRVAAQADPPVLHMRFMRTGTHVIAFDSAPSMSTLSADKFHAYLHEEGLDGVIRQRERDGTAATPGRERYRRNTKALVQVGRADAAYAKRTGQRLEILPLDDPFSAAPGDMLRFRLLFDDKPLPQALVKAWHRKDGQTVVIRTRSDADGSIRLNLPYAGAWMLSTVHMIPAADAARDEADWDSFWGNLTFALP